MNVLALIPARGGSKGIPRKNVVPLAGRPLIAWSIEAALQSGCFTRVIVSTDDEEIAAVSRQYGAEVPFMRPAELARDDSSGHDVCEHALRWMDENTGDRSDYLFELQPTSPLRLTADIQAAMQLLQKTQAPAVVGVCEASPHPYLARKVGADGTLSDFLPREDIGFRRQSYPAAFAVNGAIYVATREAVLDLHTFSPPGTVAYIMPPERSLDIDTPWDLHLAELIMQDRLTSSRP